MSKPRARTKEPTDYRRNVRSGNSATDATGGLGVLTADTDTPVVAETTVGADLLQALKVITESDGDLRTVVLEVLARLPVLLSVEEPQRDVEGLGVFEDAHDLLDFFGCEATSTTKEEYTTDNKTSSSA